MIPDFTNRLAELLACYENDEPHATDDSGHYPEITWEQIDAWLKQPHDGDCVQQPQPCMRCHAEHYHHKAQWLNERLRGRE